MQTGFFNTAPLWLVFVSLFGALSLATYLGMVLSRSRRGVQDSHADEGYLLSATLALLGLLIGFTFSMTLGRYDTRRETVVAEANAIGTAWLRAGLLEGAQANALRASLRTYAQQRLVLAHSGNADLVEAQSTALQQQIWTQARAAAPAMPQPTAALLISGMNDMFDAASSRRAEREARIPAFVLDMLMIAVVASAGMVGYVLGGNARRHGVATVVLLALLSLAIVMILDLDRPWSGLIRIPMTPLERTVADMQ